MERLELQKRFIKKLKDFGPPKWGASHTEEVNLFKGLPKHIRGRKETKEALAELYREGIILRWKKTGEIHVSLNPEKKREIDELLGW